VVEDLRGSTDADGRVLSVTQRCVADEIAAAADLVKGKAAGMPVAHVRGLSQYVQNDETSSAAKELIRTGPEDWFSYGAVEAVRSALGVEPGSARASEVGIPSLGPEDLATRAGRALRVALLTCPEASGRLDGHTIALVAGDDFTLGIAAARAEVALRGEGLTTTHLTHTPHTRTTAMTATTPTPTEVPAHEDDLTALFHALIVFH
jgi:coenzyme F420-0:L-glutamate ligase/coenzyme F420-1:gamma-L-glutamate ligase